MRLKVEEQVPKELFERMVEVARQLRREETPSEKTLWNALRDRRLRGVKFRRQQPIGPFVADFYCHEYRLVLEVDGPIHQFQEAQDDERDALLEAAGLRIMRVPSQEVEQNLPGVLCMIVRLIETLSPLPAGEGWP